MQLDGSRGSLRLLSPPSDGDGDEDPAVAAAAWSKGKRSRHVKLMIGGGEDHSAMASSRQDV